MHMPKLDGPAQSAFIMHIFSLMFATPHAVWTNAQIGDEWKPWVIGWPTKGLLFKNGLVRAMDATLQMESTYSDYALLAQRGVQIMWVINRDNDQFLGRMQNGQWIPSKPRGVYPANQTVTQPAAQTAGAVAMNPELPGDTSLTAISDDFIDPNRLPDIDIDIDEFVETYCYGDEDPGEM
jgi:hypothetical protein